MKISIAQINTTPCNFVSNVNEIIENIDLAGKKNCKLIVFPELSIPGYLCQDLMYDQNFINSNYNGIKQIEKKSLEYPDLRIVVGHVDVNTKGIGKPFYNMAIVINNGSIVARYAKQLLPFYDVFDEGRYFEPGSETSIFTIDGVRFGITICEDIWNDKEQISYSYKNNPVQQYRDLKTNVLINLSSSPYTKDKPLKRQLMIDNIAKSFEYGVIYVNQVGGQDELVFDGCSCYVNVADKLHGNVTTRYLLATHGQENVIFELGKGVVESRDVLRDQLTYMKNMLVMGLRDYIKKSGFKQVVLGSSGGIDSALVACLASEAIGPENVHCIMMPSIFSSEHSVIDAQTLHKNLGCNEYMIPITHIQTVENLAKGFKLNNGYNPIADENIQARIRGSYLMWFSNAIGSLLLTTGNKTELAIGYFTLYGDACGGYAPICDLYKMDVYAIAKQFYKNLIPANIIAKIPSAELAEGQFDEKELPPYPILDKIVEKYVEHHIHTWDMFISEVCKEDCEKAGVNKEEYNKVIYRIDRNEFKRRQIPIGTKISKKSFGTGRRVPIVKGEKVF